jgi:putative oxidoreductase
MKKILNTKYNENSWALGLLIIRLTVGVLMMFHGLDKLQDFDKVKGMSQIFGSPADGILVVFAELFCSILLILGLFTRIALIPLIITMAVAFFKVHNGALKGEHNGEVACIYLLIYVGLLFTGPGKLSVDRMIAK